MTGSRLNFLDAWMEEPSSSMLPEMTETSTSDIAIIGMALRFPGAETPDAFWQLLCEGKDLVAPLPRKRKKDVMATVQRFHPDKEGQFYEAAFLSAVDGFDYAFFDLSPKEAEYMDPEQRLFLQTAWQAIEDAGYGGQRIRGTKTGVYAGYSHSSVYGQSIRFDDPEMAALYVSGTASAMIPSRLSYLLDLKGPAMVLNTACSSSLVAVHTACQALRSGDCDMALAGGVKVDLYPIQYQNIGILSTQYRSRTFDDGSDGTAGGEGVAAVMLKPFASAVRDGDQIYGLIKGSAVNQDGSSIGLTAPNSEAQAAVMTAAWKDAGIDPETIGYMEAHGTGTKLGDPVEIDGMTKAFRAYTDKRQFCAVGSVKTNIGHLDNSAGIAGLIKAVLTLKHAKIPASLHFQRPNRKIDFVDSPVYVQDELTEWPAATFPRRCGVSSFGLSGTNCHVVLEEAPAADEVEAAVGAKASDSPAWQLFTLSAKSMASWRRLLAEYVQFLAADRTISLTDVCYTANTGRWHHPIRSALVCRDRADLLDKLQALLTADRARPADTPPQPAGTGSMRQLLAADIFVTRGDERISSSSVSSLDELPDSWMSMDEQEQLHTLRTWAMQYVQGADLPWERLYRQQKRKKISLPVYPFDEKRCWVSPGRDAALDWCHTRTWERASERSPSSEASSSVPRTVLCIHAGSRTAIQLVNALREDGHAVEEAVYPHPGESHLSQQEMETSQNEKNASASSAWLGTEEDYVRWLGSFRQKPVDQIVHMALLDESESGACTQEELEASLHQGVYSLFNLTKALVQLGFSHPIDLVLLADHVHQVTGEEVCLKPEHAACLALGRVVRVEYPNLQCRSIDLDHQLNIDKMMTELQTPGTAYLHVYRDGQCYTEKIEQMNGTDITQGSSAIIPNGTYIVTGGGGGLGLETAKYVASQAQVNLILLQRSGLPERKEWEQVLAHTSDPKLVRQLKGIMDIERSGSRVTVCQADVANLMQMKRVMADIRQQFGAVNGIFHCAGIAGDGYLARKSRDTFAQVMAAKVWGTWVLEQVTMHESLDFMMYYSSLSSLVGSAGQGDYAAANAYMDAFAAWRNRHSKRTVTINWSAWEEVGMAVDHQALERRQQQAGMKTDEALDVLDRVLTSPGDQWSDQWIISKTRSADDTEATVGQQDKPQIEQLQASTVRLTGVTSGSGQDEEQWIAQIWRELLGFEEMDVQDNFFEIGGNSILIVKMHALIEQRDPGMVSVVDLFSYPTIQGLAAYLRKVKHARLELQDLPDSAAPANEESDKYEDELLHLFEAVENGNMSMDEAFAMYEQMGREQDGKAQ
ncbi:type I polyketide synthase [Marinicrinis sediminis]|uniref:SDR family NAD(P)-dependent oxidoreductase n=1 Tax=Marinicrinis sediminis TaxID=1652465 RepID=A0ABW5R9I2_9BACL